MLKDKSKKIMAKAKSTVALWTLRTLDISAQRQFSTTAKAYYL